MADNTDPQLQSYSPTGNTLETLGGIISGLTRSRSDAGLGAVGNMLNQHAYAQYEKATRPTLLKNMQKNYPQMGLSDDMVNYYGGMDTPTFQNTIMPTLQKQMLEHGKGEGASQRVTMNGISGDYFPSSGRTAWLSKGEDFYQPQKTNQPKTLTGNNAILAKQLNLGGDPTQWTSDQAAQYERAATALALSRQKVSPPQAVPEVLLYGTDASGAPVVTGVTHPRTGGAPSLAGTTKLPFAPIGHGAGAAKKPMTPGQIMAMRKSAMDQAAKDAPYLSSTAQIQAAANDLMAKSGVNPKTLQPFKDGERYMFSDGRTRTWKNP